MMTSATALRTEAVNGANDPSKMTAVMITGKNVPANASIAEKARKTRCGRMIIPGVCRNADRYWGTCTGNNKATGFLWFFKHTKPLSIPLLILQEGD